LNAEGTDNMDNFFPILFERIDKRIEQMEPTASQNTGTTACICAIIKENGLKKILFVDFYR